MGELLLSEKRGVKTYLVENSKWGNQVIRKVLDQPFTDKSTVREFLSELKLLQNQDIPGIRQPLGVEEDAEKPTAYFEYFDGFTLKKLIEVGKNDIDIVVSTGIFLADVLTELHNKNIIHKGISSHNIIYNSKSREFCLIDFSGSSTIKEKKDLLGGSSDLEGDIEYLSPEQTGRVNRRVDHRSDLYSIGIVLYELATGTPPFSGYNFRKVIHGHIALNPESPLIRNQAVPQKLSDIILKLLEKDADNRYQSAIGLKRDLEKLKDCLAKNKAADFALAEDDASTTLTLSQNLYGRDKQLKELTSHLREVAAGGFAVDMVYGYSGAGKSALVNEAFKAIASSHGYFLSGKFDQLQRNIPYYALRQALREYVKFLLTEEEEYVEKVRQDILQKVGADTWLITEIAPELEKLLGKQPEAERATGVAGQNKFNYAFNNFLRTICSQGRPIVFFIDDLQGADLASINLLSNIIHNQQHRSLLIIGSYRNNEVSETHPLAQLMQQSEIDGIRINKLEVVNLNSQDVLDLIMDSFNLDSSQAAPLAKTIYSHTDGNAFYITQILQNLYELGRLFFDSKQKQWNWDSNVLSGIDIPENVVELMIQRVKRLDQSTQNLLSKASCFGNNFTLADLRLLLDDSEDNINNSLILVREEGLVEGTQESFSFTHDRIQQAVYSMIDEQERKSLHFNIGLQRLDNYGSDVEKIFDVVDQLNNGIDEKVSKSDRLRFAELNLIAGQQAKKSTAYDTSMQYLETGLAFAEEDWKSNYELVLNLYTNLAEAAYLSGRYDIMTDSIREVLSNARSLLEKIPVQKLEIEALKSQNNLYAAVEKGLEVLAQLNVKLPYQPSKAQVMIQFVATRIRMIGNSIESLGKLKEMKDPHMLAAMQILVSIGPAIYWASPNLIPLTIFRMVLASVKYGNTDESTFAYSTYGLLLCGVTGEIKLGNAYGQLALRLSGKVNPFNRVKGVFNVYCFVHHWNHSLRDSFVPFKDTHLLGLEAGDLEFSALSAYLYCNHQYYAGVPLFELENDFRLYSEEIRQIKQYTSLNYNLIHWQAAYNLMNETSNPIKLSGPVYDEVDMYPKHLEANDKTALFKLHLQKIILNYLFGDPGSAYEEIKKGSEYEDAVLGMYVTVAYYFYQGLVAAALIRENAEKNTSNKQLSLLRKSIKKFRHWSKYNQVNNLGKYELLLAEYFSIKDKPEQAIRYYRQAIDTARKNNVLQDLALANELAGKYYLNQDESLSNFYLTNAYIAYEKWGARVKSKELLYTHKLDSFINSFVENLNEGYSFNKASALEKIDFGTITEAAETISDQIDYASLKKVLLKILAENAGAEKAILFNVRNNYISLEESWPDQSATTQSYAESIIDKAIDSSDIIVTDRANTDLYFKNDPHILNNNIKSALCLPLFHQNELLAVIYLENNMIYGAFSSSRLEFLKLLSGQMAISLKNASLYSNLNESYDYQVELKNAYSKYVPLDVLGLLGKESVLDVGLGDQIQRTVTVMFIDIIDYTTLSEKMTPKENFDFINGVIRRIGPVIRQNNGVISQFLGDGAMAIFKDSADQSLEAAIQIQTEIRNYNEERAEKGRKAIGMGVGIHTGKVMLGIIGEKMRMDQNVISDNVNIASRVQSLTRSYNTRILFTDATKNKLQNPDQFKFRYLGKTNVKGRQKEIEIYECLDEPGLSKEKLSSISSFNAAVHAYYSEEYDKAIAGLERIVSENPEDEAAKIFLDRSRSLVN